MATNGMVTAEEMRKLTPAALAELVNRLNSDRAAAEAKLASRAKITFKVGEKGALSMYGLGRFPVTLYKSQWKTLLANVAGIEQALRENDGRLAEKA